MLEAVLALSWRAYPAALLALVGMALVGSGFALAWGVIARSRPRGPFAWARVYLRVFRRVVVGLALVGFGAGWGWQVAWLAAASLCIGAGELLESSYYLWVLGWGVRKGLIPLGPGTDWTPARPLPGTRR